jgi:hypothetical protein
MMCPARSKYIPYFKAIFGEDVFISMDQGEGIWENRKRASLAYDKEATHHVVIQDDAIICENFLDLAEKEIEKRPDHAFSFYFGNRRNMQEKAKIGEQFGGTSGYWFSWGVAICLPTKIIDECMEYCDRIKGYDKHDDTRIAKFVKFKKIPVWYPIPSLVEHRHEEPSTMQSNEGVSKRKAYKFIDDIKK